jgi:Mg2+-importing ATPase
VDPEQIAKPRPWSMGQISRFILFIGPCSSVFDYTTFFIMWFVFQCGSAGLHCPEALVPQMTEVAARFKDVGMSVEFAYRMCLFQTGWFVESLLTQTLIIHVIRTNRIPFLHSWASWPLTVTSVLIMAVGMYLPFSPVAKYLNFAPLPPLYFLLITLTMVCYVVLTQLVKTWLFRRRWI